MESKENVAGFVTIDVEDLDEAIAIAKKWPPKDQAVEIRPVVTTTTCSTIRSAEQRGTWIRR